MSDDNKQDEKTTRVIDLRIPLPYLLTVIGSLGWVLILMWFTLNQLVKQVSDLQITVQAGSTSFTVLASEQALLKYRLESVEAAIKTKKVAP